MIRLASSLMAASALHIAVLTGPGWWHDGSSHGHAAQRDAQAAEAKAHEAGWQWRLVPQREAAMTAAPIAPTREQQAKADDQPVVTAQHEAAAPPKPSQDEYLPRRELSQPPKALGMIDIPFPPGVPTPGRYKAVLALYIDEQGVVRHVKTVDEALPAAYEEAARVSFQTASFQPGEQHGHAVKSLIHVEVVFDDSPTSRGMSSSGLNQAVAQR